MPGIRVRTQVLQARFSVLHKVFGGYQLKNAPIYKLKTTHPWGQGPFLVSKLKSALICKLKTAHPWRQGPFLVSKLKRWLPTKKRANLQTKNGTSLGGGAIFD
jgi:hypothetical protein